MSTSDRELLELAARAAGLLVCGWVDSSDDDDADFICLSVNIEPRTQCWDWNPLTDDGDALRLAVKLRMCVSVEYDAQAALWRGDSLEAFNESLGEDENASTRRAIVRAAAEIGRSME